LGKVFEPFFSTKRKGTGLGLSIVHQIVEGHGGDIQVESQEGEGTFFQITLPIGRTNGLEGE
jgi:signal transduction histidine kinase